MPTEKIIEIILYIIPGFLAIEIYRSVYPGKSLSEFAQAVWSIIYGVLIFLTIKLADKYYFSGSHFSSSDKYPNLKFIIALFVCGVFVGLGRCAIHWLRFKLSEKYKLLSHLRPKPQSIWAKINENTNQDWAVVYLEDNSIYIGYISEYTYDPNQEDQDFLLSKAKRVDENLKEKYIINGIGVYLNTRKIQRIEFFKGQ